MMQEHVKPIPVESPSNNRTVFFLRCLVDLQLATIVDFLKPFLHGCQGELLDVGAGQMPWLGWVNKETKYTGLDIESADDFGMTRNDNIFYYEGITFPFEDNTFNFCICIEVLEHSINPDLLLQEILRVLKPGGELLLTIPWSARRHHIPNDFQRFTYEGLNHKFAEAGFNNISVEDRGTETAVMANKAMVGMLRLLKTESLVMKLLYLPYAVFLGGICSVFLVVYNFQKIFKLKRSYDPLGYAVKAMK